MMTQTDAPVPPSHRLPVLSAEALEIVANSTRAIAAGRAALITERERMRIGDKPRPITRLSERRPQVRYG
jgi:hypothetical protein